MKNGKCLDLLDQIKEVISKKEKLYNSPSGDICNAHKRDGDFQQEEKQLKKALEYLKGEIPAH